MEENNIIILDRQQLKKKKLKNHFILNIRSLNFLFCH